MSLDIRTPSLEPGQQHRFATAPSRRTIIIMVAVAIVILAVIGGLLINSKGSPSPSNTKASGQQETCVYADPGLLTTAGHTVPNIAASEATTACVGQSVVSMLQDAASYYRLGIREFKTSEVDIFSVNNQGVMSADGDANGFIDWAKARGARVTKSTDSSGDFLTVRF